jgi:arylsulfatase A
MQAVNRLGYEENSLVVFTSDNGPETPVTLEESKGQWEDPIRDRCFGTPGPWRGMKRFVYEGGHRVPGIVRYPDRIQPGTLSSQLVNGTDWMPTLCALCNAPLPSDRVIDGTSLLPLFEGKSLERHTPACWMLPADYPDLPSMAMRQENLVMIGWFNPKKKKQGMSEWIKSADLTRFELYDLSIDVSQRNDLSAIRKEAFTRLKEKMSMLWREIRMEGPLWKKR